MTERKVHLGDGAYYDHDGYSVVLTTENGVSVTNEIFLELPCVRVLLKTLCRDYGTDAIRAMLPEGTVSDE